MKKLLSIVIAITMLLCAFTAMGEDGVAVPAELVGKWRGTGTPKNGGPSIDLTATIEADGSGVMLVGIVLAVIGGRINDSREAAWFREHLANDPNAPDKLPVIDK